MAGDQPAEDPAAPRGPDAASVDEYIAGFPPETRGLLEDLRAIILQAAPSATERISYRMPTFDLHGRVLIYFAGYQGHVGMYPVTGTAVEALEEELVPYRHGKGTLRFALDRPLPADLIRRIILARAGEIQRRRKK